MAENQYYLTTNPAPADHPRHGELIAVISLGHPQKGDAECLICTVEIVKDQAAADVWYKEQMITKPWIKRQ